MHITLIMRSSVNGKITHSNTLSRLNWSSPEDAELFNKLKKKHSLIVMGRKTYIANKKHIKLQNNILRVVFTRNPEKYCDNEVTDQLEFVNTSPKKLIQNLESRGYTKMLLLGGSEVNALFFKNNLIDQLHLTIEPYLFGLGKPISSDEELAVQLQLTSIKKLNDRGTFHAIYRVIKP